MVARLAAAAERGALVGRGEACPPIITLIVLMSELIALMSDLIALMSDLIALLFELIVP